LKSGLISHLNKAIIFNAQVQTNLRQFIKLEVCTNSQVSSALVALFAERPVISPTKAAGGFVVNHLLFNSGNLWWLIGAGYVPPFMLISVCFMASLRIRYS
jgi:hypothetical protein